MVLLAYTDYYRSGEEHVQLYWEALSWNRWAPSSCKWIPTKEFQYYSTQKARNEAALCPETTHQEKVIGDLPTWVNGPFMFLKGLQECAEAYVFQVRVAASEEKRSLMP